MKQVIKYFSKLSVCLSIMQKVIKILDFENSNEEFFDRIDRMLFLPISFG